MTRTPPARPLAVRPAPQRPPHARLSLAATTALAALAALGCSVLAACGAVPGSDAVSIGGLPAGVSSTIGADQLGDLTDTALAAVATGTGPAYTRTAVQQQIMSQLVEERVLESLAARRGLPSVTTQVASQVAQANSAAGDAQTALQQAIKAAGLQAGSPPPFAGLDVVDTINALALEVADSLIPDSLLAQQYQSVSDQINTAHLAHIVVATPALASTLAAQLRAAPGTFASVARLQSTDVATKATGGDQGTAPLSSLTPARLAAVKAAAPGAILGPAPTSGGYEIVQVIAVTNKTLAEARPQLLQLLLSNQQTEQQIATAINRAVVLETQKLTVKVNPRFGSIDVSSFTVSPPVNPLASPGRAAPSDGTAAVGGTTTDGGAGATSGP